MKTSWTLFWIASITFFMQSVDTTMLYIALPTIAEALHQPVLHMELIVISYVVTVVAFTPVNGWMAAWLGERKTYLVAIAIFMAGSLLCTTATSIVSLSAFRFIQGIGGALMLPIIRTIILRTTPDTMKLLFLNRITLLGLLGTMIGPVLIFVLNIPLCLVCLMLTRKHIPANMQVPHFRGDTYKLMLLVGILFLGAFLLTAIPKNIISLPLSAALAIAGFSLAFLYFKQDMFATRPQPRENLFTIKTFSIGVTSGIVTRILLSSIPVVLSLMLQTKLACDPTTVSLILLLFSSGTPLSKMGFEPLIKPIGYRKLLLHTTVITSLCIFSMGAAVQENATIFIGIIAVLLSILISTLHSAESTLAFSNLSHHTYNNGNNIMTVTQLLSIMISMALTFPMLRFLTRMESTINLNSFSLLFILLGIGLPICCFIFMHLNEDDGHHFIHGR
ncbi:MAG: MFS transporter [Symbiopectobacterium sp.]|uniref:MFS transporter n=1 Tax=Symbiopectobacterium sp. TaxID=2952789 RepID=UPI0039E7EB2D